MIGNNIETASREKKLLVTNPTNFYIDIDVYKFCFLDYVRGMGPFSSPFAFLSYGISYGEMVSGIKHSSPFLHFIILFILDTEKSSEYEKALDILDDSGITPEELQTKLQEVPL